ncbi:hypothetical protein ABFG93_13190 [Pseudalkalibacillus hwajinpoensis]|uniref:hypothetical protein n=1 Tax=Guptibacillus hwajinpoensis TaxID=208199 RepID=UPI00325A5CC0
MKIRLTLLLLLTLITACSGELKGKEAPKPNVEIWSIEKQSNVKIPHLEKTICWNDCGGVLTSDSDSHEKPKIVDIGKHSINISFETMEPKPSTINLINETTGEHIKLDSDWMTLSPPSEGETVYRLHFYWNGKGGFPLGESTYRFGVISSDTY